MWGAHPPIAGALSPTSSHGTASAVAYRYELNKRITRAIITKGRAVRPPVVAVIVAPAALTSITATAQVDRPTPLADPVATEPKALREAAVDAA